MASGIEPAIYHPSRVGRVLLLLVRGVSGAGIVHDGTLADSYGWDVDELVAHLNDCLARNRST